MDHFFRTESGRLIALLTRVFGFRNYDLVEDVVQTALVQALQTWQTNGIPDDPAGWIYRVARNKLLDSLRRQETAKRLAPELEKLRSGTANDSSVLEDLFLDSEIQDSQLRMIFACSHPTLAMESRIALTLKTLCEFSLSEIARALLWTEETAKKRVQRARQKLISEDVTLDVPPTEQLPERLTTVHAVLYLLFNEGYSTTRADQPIRHDLCEEAGRLCHLLCEHRHCSTGETFALLALMLFHGARFASRLDQNGSPLLLEEQDRCQWNYDVIRRAVDYLRQAMTGHPITCYHLEAGIAMYHCKAPTFADTNWQAILWHYDRLIELHASPIYLLNRAIALSYVSGPQAGIDAVQVIRNHPQLSNYHLLDATLGELYRRMGNLETAAEHFRTALTKTQSVMDQQLLRRRLEQCVCFS